VFEARPPATYAGAPAEDPGFYDRYGAVTIIIRPLRADRAHVRAFLAGVFAGMAIPASSRYNGDRRVL